KRRRPTAEIERIERTSGDAAKCAEPGINDVRAQLQLLAERADKCVDPAARPAGRTTRVHDEVAVRTQRHTEWNVDVEAPRRGPGGGLQAGREFGRLPFGHGPGAARVAASAISAVRIPGSHRIPALGRSSFALDVLLLAPSRR